MHGAHIDKAAASVHNGKRSPFPAFEEKKARVLFAGVRRLFGNAVDIIKYRFILLRPLPKVIDNGCRLLGVDVTVPNESEVFQGVTAPVACMNGEKEPPVRFKNRRFHNLFDGRLLREMSVHRRVPFLYGLLFLQRLARLHVPAAGTKEQECRKGKDAKGYLHRGSSFSLMSPL